MDAQQLAELYQIPIKRAAAFAALLSDAFRIYDISTVQRKACFMAQIGHESGLLAFTREIWGPTKQQLRYEPVTPLSKTLGNVHSGDGKAFLGRGCIQTTGRTNYRLLTARLRRKFPACPDFEKDPSQLEKPFWAMMSAGDYWEMRNLNKYADAYDFAELTRRINGGYNGLAHRQHLYNRIYAMLLFME